MNDRFAWVVGSFNPRREIPLMQTMRDIQTVVRFPSRTSNGDRLFHGPELETNPILKRITYLPFDTAQ